MNKAFSKYGKVRYQNTRYYKRQMVRMFRKRHALITRTSCTLHALNVIKSAPTFTVEQRAKKLVAMADLVLHHQKTILDGL